MRNIVGLIFLYFISLSFIQKKEFANGPNSEKPQNQVYCFDEKKIPKLCVDSPLLNIFQVIISQDSLCSYFENNLSCFLVSISKYDNHLFLNIRPTYLNAIDSISYFGDLIVENTHFFCYGEKNTGLFQAVGIDSTIVRLQWIDLKNDKNKLIDLKETALCDGCSERWHLKFKEQEIVINAEICTPKKE